MTIELPAAIQRVFDATNSADDDGFIAAFAPDGFIDDWGRKLSGSEGIASWNSTDNIGKQATWEALSVTEQGQGKYLVSIRTGGNGYNGISPFVFTVLDDKVQSMVISAG